MPADSAGHNEMNDSTTGTLLSLGKTEFDRRIKKKYVFTMKQILRRRSFVFSDKNYLKMPFRIIIRFQRGTEPP